MTTSHTPGPWQVSADVNFGGRTVIDALGRGITFAPVFHGSAAHGIAEAAANARLIAAAPDMLTALREIVAELPGFGHDDEPTGTIDTVAHTARALIARIDGAP